MYVDGTVLVPVLKKALGQPAGIARAGLQIVLSALLGAGESARVLVADPNARRVLCFRPQHQSEVALVGELRAIAQSLRRTRLEHTWTWVRGRLRAPWRSGWALPAELARSGERGVFLYAGLNIRPGYRAAMKRARELYGTKLVLYLHDLLPLTQPTEYTSADRAREFHTFVSDFVGACDLVITSSRHTAAQIPEAVAPLVSAVPPVAVVPMAHEYRPWEAASARPAALAALGDQDFVLCVGTLSARKNQVGLVRAWQRYRAATRRARPAHLVLAGAPGAGSNEVLALLDATDHCGGTVHVLPQTTDAELNWLYQNCLFTAYVSFAEGFGLPIGESLWLGKVCLASSTTSMPEVGGDLAVYIDPHCVDQIAEGLRRLLEEPETLHTLTGRISRDALRTWRDFQNDLALAIRLHFSR